MNLLNVLNDNILFFIPVQIFEATLRMSVMILDVGIPFLFTLYMIFGKTSPDDKSNGIHETVCVLLK